jgi:hypothetical protein
MTDSFLDRLGDQLSAAELQLTAAVPARRRARRRPTPKSAALILVGLAIAVPAVAATHPWRPVLGRPQLHDTPAGTSDSPVPHDTRSVVEVLRRPQTSLDRGPTARKLLRLVGQQFTGVRPASVRLLTPAPSHHALILSARGVGRSPQSTAPEQRDPICLVFSGGSTCGSTAALRTTGIVMSAGPNVRGIVPDGVARVVLTFNDGRTVGADVHNNVFWITGVPTTSRTVPGPPGSGIKRPPPLITSAQFTVHWLNTARQLIGPIGGP